LVVLVPSKRDRRALPAARGEIAEAGILNIPWPQAHTRHRTRRGGSPEFSMLQHARHRSDGRRGLVRRARQFPTSHRDRECF
jgi:hypothetical protein